MLPLSYSNLLTLFIIVSSLLIIVLAALVISNVYWWRRRKKRYVPSPPGLAGVIVEADLTEVLGRPVAPPTSPGCPRGDDATAGYVGPKHLERCRSGAKAVASTLQRISPTNRAAGRRPQPCSLEEIDSMLEAAEDEAAGNNGSDAERFGDWSNMELDLQVEDTGELHKDQLDRLQERPRDEESNTHSRNAPVRPMARRQLGSRHSARMQQGVAEDVDILPKVTSAPRNHGKRQPAEQLELQADVETTPRATARVPPQRRSTEKSGAELHQQRDVSLLDEPDQETIEITPRARRRSSEEKPTLGREDALPRRRPSEGTGRTSLSSRALPRRRPTEESSVVREDALARHVVEQSEPSLLGGGLPDAKGPPRVSRSVPKRRSLSARVQAGVAVPRFDTPVVMDMHDTFGAAPNRNAEAKIDIGDALRDMEFSSRPASDWPGEEKGRSYLDSTPPELASALEEDPLAAALEARARVQRLLQGVTGLAPSPGDADPMAPLEPRRRPVSESWGDSWEASAGNMQAAAPSREKVRRSVRMAPDDAGQAEMLPEFGAVADDGGLGYEGQLNEITQLSTRSSFSSASDLREARRREKGSSSSTGHVGVGRPVGRKPKELQLGWSGGAPEEEEEEPDIEHPVMLARIRGNPNSQQLEHSARYL